MRTKTAICLAVAILLPLSALAQERRDYECFLNGIELKFTVIPGEMIDKIKGKLVLSRLLTLKVTGFYDNFTNTVVAKGRFTDGSKGINRAITGNYDDESDAYGLTIFFGKKRSLDLKCTRKREGNLTGRWLINDSSFVLVDLKEDKTGTVTGNGLRGFKGYTVAGSREGPTEVTLSLLAPDDGEFPDDDTTYSLNVCGSGKTMIGSNDSLISPDAIWCKRSKTSTNDRAECPFDPTCTQ